MLPSIFPLRSLIPATFIAYATLLNASHLEARLPKGDSTPTPASKLALSQEAPLQVIYAPGATPAEIYAAKELAAVLGRIFHREITPIASETLEPEGFNFVIGHHPANADLPLAKLKAEESIVRIAGYKIQLAGGRSEKMTRDQEGREIPLHDRGTLYAVYDFLEKLGVRWYRPEPWGEHLPKLEEIVLKDGETRTHPVYEYRYGISHYNTYGLTDEWLKRHHLAKEWAIRSRMNSNLWREKRWPEANIDQYGGNYVLDFSHAYRRMLSPDDYFATHPEYFALIKGERSSDPFAQLCLSNPEVEEIVYAYLKRVAQNSPNQMVFSLDPNDKMLWCECASCSEMDVPRTKASYGNGAGGVSMSNRVARFNNKIAARLAKEVPGASVGYYAYAQHTDPPSKDIVFEPNVYVQPAAFASTFSDFSRKLNDPTSSPNKRFKAVLEGYRGRVKLMAREYWSFYAWPGPLPIVHTLQDRIQAYHRDYGMNGIYSETHPCWGPQGMSLYFYPWLLRNPYADVEAEKELYYRNFYGPAYQPMKSYHEYLEKIGQGGVYYCSGGSFGDELFTAGNIDKLAGWIAKARKLIGDREPYAKRFEGVAAGHELSEMALEFRTLRDANRPEEALAKLQEMEALYMKHPNGSVFDNAPGPSGRENGMLDSAMRSYRTSMNGPLKMLAVFDSPEVMVDLTKNWRFHPMDEKELKADGWKRPGFSERDWSRLDAGRPWQRQGYEDHVGTGLYRKKFTTPKALKGTRQVLYFEQIDGHAAVYLEGKLIGERQLGPAYEGYDDIWYIDLTDHLAKGMREVQLAVEVTKDRSVGGLTKPVYLLQVAAIRPPEE